MRKSLITAQSDIDAIGALFVLVCVLGMVPLVPLRIHPPTVAARRAQVRGPVAPRDQS